MSCNACGGGLQVQVLNLGEQPLANSYVSDTTLPEPVYPLAVNLCLNCYHLQLTHVVDPAEIYQEYPYVSGTTATGRAHFEWFARYVLEQSNINTILDIGCNDGTQLDVFKGLGVQTFGIDPAQNLHALSSKRHDVKCSFFQPILFDQKFDAVVAQNVFAHNPDPLGFLDTCKSYMHDDSLLFIQTSQAEMIQHGEFDTIYHEHINFFNAKSFVTLANRAGLGVVDIIKTPIHGVSYVFVLSKTQSNPARIKNIIAMESLAGLYKLDTYSQWSKAAYIQSADFAKQLQDYRDRGYRIVGYGAAAKANTILNFAQVDLDFIVDDNPLKIGQFTPGRKIPILSSAEIANLAETDRVAFIPLAWNFFDEIVSKIQAIRSNPNDCFIRLN